MTSTSLSCFGSSRLIRF
nr:unnamed protein product [Callosobruchus chinensis]